MNILSRYYLLSTYSVRAKIIFVNIFESIVFELVSCTNKHREHEAFDKTAIVCSMYHVSLTAWKTVDLHFQTIVVGESSFTPEFVDWFTIVERTSLVQRNIPISEHRVQRACVFLDETLSGNNMDAKQSIESLPRNISESKVNPKNWRWFWVSSPKILQ